MRILCFTFILISGLYFDAYALKEKTHYEINKSIAQRNIADFSLDSYINNQLGFFEGVNLSITSIDADGKISEKPIFEWLSYGGEQEDRPGAWYDYINLLKKTRSLNHFHNPLETSWDNAGLNDMGKSGQSSILWAQNQNQDPNGDMGGNWSWGDARRYFYEAVTGINIKTGEIEAMTEGAKHYYLAKTFRGLGQLMHLVEDSSVPEHVRNSAHVVPAYESKIRDFHTEKNNNGTLKYGTLWQDLLANPIVFDKKILEISSNDPAPVPISRIVDTDNYTRNNPDPDITKTIYLDSEETVAGPQVVGIAEYANANFFNKDTMFDEDNFPHPALDDTEPEPWRDTSTNLMYLKKKAGYGDPIEHLAVAGLSNRHMKHYYPQYHKYEPVGLNTECFKDYAARLIPRAVGYAAGLLKYFFRGTLKVAPPDEQVYALIDGSQAPQQFTRIKAKVTNTTPDEEMKDGTLVVVAEYKVIPDYQPDLSTYPPTATMMDIVPFSYSVSAPAELTIPLAANAARDFEFNFPDQPVPAGITDLSMYVVFKGTLGNEKDNAIAVAWQSLFEPVHQTFWNLTDRFSLNNVLKTDTEIDNDPTWQAQVDWNANGITSEWPSEPYIKPYPMSFEIGYAANNPPDQPVTPIATVDDVQPGGYIRLITLVSEPSSYVKLKSTNATVGVTEFVDIFYGTVCNGYESAFECEAKKTFRNVRQDYNVGLLRCNPLATDASGNKYCSYNESGVALTNFGPLSVGIKFGTQGQ